MRHAWVLLLLLASDDDKVDPAKFSPPLKAKSVVLKEAPSQGRPYLGVSGSRSRSEGGAVLTRVREKSPAEKAGLKKGDKVLKLDGEPVESYRGLIRSVGKRKPEDRILLLVDRGGEELELTVRLGRQSRGGLRIWKKPEFHLAVVLFEFPDVRHNTEFRLRDFERLLFSRNGYTGSDPSGASAHGSLSDYYRENSYGRLTVKGRVFDWVELDKPRAYFEDRRMGDREASKQLLPRAVELLREREGADCFDPYDGIIFVYAGRQTYKRPWMLWPHRASIKAGKKTLAYYLNAEGGKYFNALGVHAHEFGHMLGLPDQYGRGHATGVGKWCTMAIGHMGGGESRNRRPFHICVWCKERLGWVKPTAIDPSVEQWLRLAPIEDDPTMAFKFRSGSDTYYLECRGRKGFDADIDQTGLLIWKAKSRGGLDLVEAHGRKVSNASLVEMEDIPFPSFYNRHFTPDTSPAAPDGVYVTDIVRQDGSIYFKIGIRKKVKTRTIEKRSEY